MRHEPDSRLGVRVLIYAFRHRPLLVALIVAADVVVGLFVGDRLIRWELEQIRAAW